MQIGVESARAVENKRIFVVDDDEIIRAALQFMLHDEHEAHEIADWDAIFDKSVAGLPDVLLLGEGLLQRKGATCIADIKLRLKGVKILLVAATKNAVWVVDALALGADAVLTKPLTVENTRRAVDKLLGRKSAMTIKLHAV